MIFFERFRGPKKGFCRLCGFERDLTRDHVPPKSCSNWGLYVVQDLFKPSLKMPAFNGLTFRTICSQCNNGVLGPLDSELGQLSRQVKEFLQFRHGGLQTEGSYNLTFNSLPIVRSVAGHILAAYDLPAKVKAENVHSRYEYIHNLHKLYEGENLKSHSVLMWLHDYPTINILPFVTAGRFGNMQQISMFSILSFYPLGFMIIDQKYDPRRFPFYRLRTDDQVSNLNLSQLKSNTSNFPFENLKDEVLLLSSEHSYSARRFGGLRY